MNASGDGSVSGTLRLIGEHRTAIREALGDQRYALLLTRLEALATVASDDGRAFRRAWQGVRQILLELPFDHPARLPDSVRLVGTAPEPAGVAVGAQELLALLLATPDPAPEPGVSDGTPDGILRAPALSADEAHARCGGAAPPPELIRLADPQGGDRYPEFQFPTGCGTPYEIVLRINRLLLADVDPWGAAAWWLSGNTWLGGTPAALLGRRPDQELVVAAAALVEGD
ncbi:hypothetical protein OG234_03525 [Streptomyces sp. NBC_01420]|uniref:hypothetical protein n=1 Tax=Streptomyces sp. NBC_01420 TaxID=2903858 RepID=UPI0032566DC3